MTAVYGTRLYRNGPEFSLEEIERQGGYFAPLQFWLKPHEIWYCNQTNSYFRWTGDTWVPAPYGGPQPPFSIVEPPTGRGYLRYGPPAVAEWGPVDGGDY